MLERFRRRASIRVIAIGRRLFANTPVQRLPLTTWVLRTVFRLGYGNDDLELNFRGLRLVAPADDITLVPGIVGGFYERLELDIFTAVAARSSVVADVGGNIGVFACLAAAEARDSEVVVFEPVPANLDYLRRNLELNGFAERVEVVDQAISDSIGIAPIYIADSIGTHSLASANAKSERRIDVNVTTLDDWFGQRRVDLLKIDVEGFDGYVIRGAKRILSRDRPTLLVEFTPAALVAAGFDPAEMLGTIFDLYEQVYLVDEPRHRIQRVGKDQLEAFKGRMGNWNLIAVSDQTHEDVIHTVVTQHAADAASWPDATR